MHLEEFRLDQIQNGPLSAITYFHNILRVREMLVHYYKTKCEVSGKNAHFLTSLYQIQNDRKSAIISLNWPDIE